MNEVLYRALNGRKRKSDELADDDDDDDAEDVLDHDDDGDEASTRGDQALQWRRVIRDAEERQAILRDLHNSAAQGKINDLIALLNFIYATLILLHRRSSWP